MKVRLYRDEWYPCWEIGGERDTWCPEYEVPAQLIMDMEAATKALFQIFGEIDKIVKPDA